MNTLCSCETPNREYLGITCDKQDLNSIMLIQNKISCAAQAARVDAIPDGIDANRAKMFIQAAIDSLANYRWLEQDWWISAKQHYNLPKDKNIWIDFDSAQFYLIKE